VEKMLAACQGKDAPQTICLSCVNIKTHSKVFFTGHFFAVRHYKNAQQSIFLPDIFFAVHPKKCA
jgi:hypothetical protein